MVSKLKCLLIALLCAPCALLAAAPSPKEYFGFSIGEDYHLPNFTQTDAYFKKLAETSDRVRYFEIGFTEEGRRQPMLVVSAPGNLAKLERCKAISRELALAENPDPEAARALVAEGRAVVCFSGGIHASEHLSINQLIETAWQLASRGDDETLNILDNVIVLLVHSNPDGQQFVADWYNRREDPKKRIRESPPYLYHKYVGHDINRDFFVCNMKETANISRQLYTEWFPQIVFDAHQGGDRGYPIGTIVSTLPSNDPFNYNLDPLAMAQSQLVGSVLQARWISESMPGTSARGGSAFTIWGNGMLCTTPYFHNMIGIVSETAGYPTPVKIPLIPSRQVPTTDFPWPALPQYWHFRQSVEYSLTANYAVLDFAARNRDRLLLNIYRMGRNSIERGNRDHWRHLPSQVEQMKAAAVKGLAFNAKTGEIDPGFLDLLHAPDFRDPRAYIITADPVRQPDRGTVARLINALSVNGVAIHRATASFKVDGKDYPDGTYVVKAAQAFRPHVLDMFEPQEYPLDFMTNPSSRISSPYNGAGWTLAIQMGIAFDRVFDALDESLPLERLAQGATVAPLPGAIIVPGKETPVAGYLVSHRSNYSFTLANRLVKAGAPVFWLHGDKTRKLASGTLYIPASQLSAPIVDRAVAELGLDAVAVASQPEGISALRLAPTRIALWDRYGGSIPSGWVRWLLEQYEYDFELVYVQQIDESKLRDRYDVIIFSNDAIPPRASDKLPPARTNPGTVIQPKPEVLPKEYHHLLGRITEQKTIPALRRFLEQGGTVVTLGSSTCLAYYLDLPVGNALLETLPDGTQKLMTRDKFYIPGSILQAQFDPEVPLAWGMEGAAPVFFDKDPLFRLDSQSAAQGIRPAAWLGQDDYLLSGLAWGQKNAGGAVLAAEAPVGKGTLYLITPEVSLRAQPHAAFKLLFNPLHLATARE